MAVGIIMSIVIVGAAGCLVGFLLVFASEKFKVEVDPREEEILGVLPGNNCGGCGYPGCSGLAHAICQGQAPVNQCPVGGAPVGAKVAAIMGVDAGETVKKMAYVRCAGDCDAAKVNYNYSGMESCRAMAFVPGGGPKACKYGCLGCGDCVAACQFDAIHIVNGIALVDKDACKACGKCVDACPRHIIELIPYEAKEVVTCMSKDKGKDVMGVCSVGCIACHLCEKTCQHDAVHVTDNIAYIDQDKCVGCGECADKCPKKIIFKWNSEDQHAYSPKPAPKAQAS